MQVDHKSTIHCQKNEYLRKSIFGHEKYIFLKNKNILDWPFYVLSSFSVIENHIIETL